MMMDETNKDKEEIKRRLQAMKLQYAKMQRKLTKSERRKNAKNHVRRVLAEQANASSPEVIQSSSNSGTDGAAILLKEPEGGGDGRISRRSGRRTRSLQRSISFRLEDSLEEDGEIADEEGAVSRSRENDSPGMCGTSTTSNRSISSARTTSVVSAEESSEKNIAEKCRANLDGKTCSVVLESGCKQGYHRRFADSAKGVDAGGSVTSKKGMKSAVGRDPEYSIEWENSIPGKNEADFGVNERDSENAPTEGVKRTEIDEDRQRTGSVVRKRNMDMDSAKNVKVDSMNGVRIVGCTSAGAQRNPNTEIDSSFTSKRGNSDVLSDECMRRAVPDMRQSGSGGHGGSSSNTESSSVRVSRRSHRKKWKRPKRQTDTVDSSQRNSIGSSGETPSDIGESDSLLNSASQPEMLVDQACEGKGSGVLKGGEIIPDEDRGGACLRWQGIFQEDEMSHKAAWSGISSCEIGSSTVVVMYHEQTVVLWVHTDRWEARSQWTTDKDNSIMNVTLGTSQDYELLVLISLTKAAKNWISFIRYNLDSDTREVEDVTLPRILKDSSELGIILSGSQGAVMEKTGTHLCNINFFKTTPRFNFCQPKCLEEFRAMSFIAVEGAADVYLSLSSGQLGLWSSRNEGSLLEVDLSKLSTDVQVDECLWSKAEEGLLFVITLRRPSSLALCVLNPATGIILQVHNFMLPCAYQSLQLKDLSVNHLFVAAVYSNNQTLLWDVSSGRALTEIQSPDGHARGVTTTTEFIVLHGKYPHLYQLTGAADSC